MNQPVAHPRSRMWLAWLRVEAILAIAGFAAVFIVVSLRPPSEQDILAELSGDVVRVLEQSSPAQHHDHGHGIVAGDRVVCAAEAFGHDPAAVRGAGQVQWAYAYYLCAAAPPGTPWDEAARISGPVAVALTNPPVVRIAEAGAGYPDRVRALIPARYGERAFSGFTDSAVPTQLRSRYESEIART